MVENKDIKNLEQAVGWFIGLAPSIATIGLGYTVCRLAGDNHEKAFDKSNDKATELSNHFIDFGEKYGSTIIAGALTAVTGAIGGNISKKG